MRYLKIIAKSLLILGVIVIALAFYLIGTNSGNRVVVNNLHYFLPGDLAYEKLSGRVTKTLTVDDLSYHDKHVIAKIEHLELSVRAADLWHLICNIRKIKINNMHLQFAASNHKDDSDFDWSYFKHLRIENIAMTDVLISNTRNQLIHITQFDNYIENNNHIYLSLITEQGNITGKYRLHLNPKPTWNGEFIANNIDLSYFTLQKNDAVNFTVLTHGAYAHNQTIYLKVNDIKGAYGKYPILGNMQFTFRNNQLNIPASNIAIGNTTASFSGYANKEWHIQWQLRCPNLNMFLKQASGEISASGSITHDRSHPTIKAEITANRLKLADINIERINGHVDLATLNDNNINSLVDLSVTQFNFNWHHIAHTNVNMKVSTQQNQLNTLVYLALSGNNTVRGNINLPNFQSLTNIEQAINGNLLINLPTIKPLMSLLPEVGNADGRLQASVFLAGKIKKPTVKVHATLNNGIYPIPRLGITLKNIQLQADSNHSSLIEFRGSFNSGNGRGSVSGNVDINKPSYPLHLKLLGNKLSLANLPEYKIIITPTVDLSYVHNTLNLNGTIDVPDATIKIANFNNSETLPSDVIFTHQKQTNDLDVLKNTALHLQLTLGNHVRLENQNIQSQLMGNLTLSKVKNAELTAIGELYTVNGVYRAYGKELTIQQGKLQYTGNLLSNPGLNILAIKKVSANGGTSSMANATDAMQSAQSRTVTAGIKVSGTLKTPIVTLYSQPGGLSQADILSYIIFDAPRSQITSLSALTLLNDVAMGQRGSGNHLHMMTDKIQNTFGLSSFDVGQVAYYDPQATTDPNTSTTAVSVGKKINKDLSLHYSVGLFKPISVLNLRYQLMKLVYFQAEASMVESGADLFYEIEYE